MVNLLFETFFLKVTNICYTQYWGQIFFILQIDVTEELEKLYNQKPKDGAKKRVPRTFKLKRAEMNHMQTLREISEQQRQENKEEQKTDEPMPGTSKQNP